MAPSFSSRFNRPVSMLLLIVACSASTSAQDDEFPPGLVATYRAGNQSVQRVDNVLSFDWGAASPDERLPTGPFTAEWSGNLLARLPGKHTFHVFVAGDVSVFVDDNEVLKTSEQWGFASGESFELGAGDHVIRVTYSTPAESDKPRSRLAVYWSSDAFTLEPLPADVLFQDEPSPQLSATARGHLLVDANRCAACHHNGTNSENSGLSELKAPALDRVKGSQDKATLVQRLWRPQNVVANSHMPSFDLSPSEAESVAEFLLSVSKKPHDEKEIKFKDDDADAGSKLLTSLGCVACHQLPGTKLADQPLAGAYAGPELVNVAPRRPAEWLDRWLRAPETLNADHRMPVFDLTKDERRQLVAALTQTDAKAIAWTDSNSSLSEEERIADGKRIVVEANCAACHSIPGIKSKAFAPLAGDSFGQESGDCINPADMPNLRSGPGKRVPSFMSIVAASNEQRVGDSPTDTDAIAAYVKSRHSNGQRSAADTGKLLLNRNGCIACHDRDQSRGLSSIANKLQNAHPGLKGQSQGLVPPSLTAVGDKLNDDYLKQAVAGEQKERRLPWLLVRMPKFAHSDADRAALVQHLITTDRIPAEADSARQDVLAFVDLSGKSQASSEELLLGNQLTGAGGFNCVACHKAGPFEPRNVALGTRGSDIMTMGNRMRPRFFQRWMKNPIRVVAGIEMPAIKKAIPSVLDGSLPKQIGVMWKALSDDRFTPPTVTSRFEQVVNVEPGGAPRIIRDVFTIGIDKNRDAVARAMAIGFGNGHNILVDLDTMQLRLWTIGEFARQRTEGKSWYWDMPGTVVSQPSISGSTLRLKSANGSILQSVEDESRFSELVSMSNLPDGVELITRSHFDPEAGAKPSANSGSADPHFTKPAWNNDAQPLVTVKVRHRFQSVKSGDGSGWKHSVEYLDGPPGFVLISPADLTADARAKGLPTSQQFEGRWTKKQDAELSLETSASQTSMLDLAVPKVIAAIQPPVVKADAESVTSTPGFTGTRLPLDNSIMPTAMTWLPDGRMAFTSLKGHVWIATDTDGDGLVDQTSLFEEGLAVPFGILADTDGSIIVSHKPEVLRLRDTDGDGRAELREVVASGWGYNDNYHDWTSGLIRDDEGNLYVGLGSDYSQKKRPKNQDRWRGGVIKIDPSGIVTPLGMSMRYPMSLAFDSHGNLFATDNQGVQNTFNEINHILPGRHYGVPSAHQPTDNITHETASLMVPHPWTRSVNSIVFLPDDFSVKELRGHGIGCEYDSRFLMRFTVQNVDGTLQGASYRFSLPNQEAGGSNFIGPICSAISPEGELVIGSIWDSGWQGGQNTGGITRLVPSAEGLPNGIRELTATPSGFEVEFFRPVNAKAATNAASWSIQGYTREWGGSYATPDSGRHTLTAETVEVLDDGKRVRIKVKELKPNYAYDVSAGGLLTESEKLWPSEAHYSMKVVPK
ncbi:cbb3-type cytochrome c oxidase subunit II [Fuerstiella marisgermanici]|uniref:Cbb3-type cytochrome c oxidase subunit II n=2 Tax=Fuerstiella marisgermanici TaxID=1891926 RepID=A0A1P8WNK2_9PLAN|nr:cbb3-type cytochrome c oxidase subunit II [Fuerstiella marisgermanici]